MTTTPKMQELVKQKVEAFELLQPEFEESILFLQDVHGQKRLTEFSVADVVRYLHARWMDECRTSLLSISKTVKEYEGKLCLQLLSSWQVEEDTAGVVAFLHRRLDMEPLAQITRQIHEARSTHSNDGLARRLVHGRIVLLNRGLNLMKAMETLFALSEEDLLVQVRAACLHYQHSPEQIEQQLQAMETPLYSFVPHQLLAQRNMVVMNKLGVNATAGQADQLGDRSWRVVSPEEPLSPYAEHVVQGYQELVSPTHNNIKDHQFVDRPEVSTEGEV